MFMDEAIAVNEAQLVHLPITDVIIIEVNIQTWNTSR
jgi:hypothetical protein